MTKIIVLFSLIIASVSVKAQVKKGDILLGGQLSINNGVQNSEPYRYEQKGMSIGISAGKAIKDNNVLGFDLSFSHSTTSSDVTTDNDQESNGFKGSIFYRRYKALGKSFYLFGQANAGVNYSKQKASTIAGVSDTKSLGEFLSFTPGIAYQVSPHLMMEINLYELAGLNYTTNKYTYGDPEVTRDKSHYFNFYSNLNGGLLQNLSIGFKLIF